MSRPGADLSGTRDVLLLALAAVSIAVLIDIEEDHIVVAYVVAPPDEDLRSIGIDDYGDAMELMTVPMGRESLTTHETETAK